MNKDNKTLKWPNLIQGALVRRYKRFLVDVRLRNGHVVTALCPNTGSMRACSEPGRTVFLSHQNRPERRLKYTWEMIEMPGSLVGVNTGIPNSLVKASIMSGKIPELAGFEQIHSEVKYGKNSRIDLLLLRGKKRCFVEIKNCTLVEKGIAYFPDAITSRGLKHLKELQNEVRSGNRAFMFYLVQRMDAKVFRPAYHIDPEYSRELKKAKANGVKILVYDVHLDLEGISLRNRLAYRLQKSP